MEPQAQQIEEISPSGYKRQLNKSQAQSQQNMSPYKNSASPEKQQMMQQNQ